MNQELILFDFKTKEWNLGQSLLTDGTPFSIPENASFVRIDPSLGCEHSKAFVLGGHD